MIWIQGILMFIFSVSNDWFGILWHEARENKEPVKGAILAFILGTIAWLSLIWVVDSSYWLAIPDLMGTVVGSYYGIKYHHAPLPIAIALGFHRGTKKED
jgi:hypothetical protein